MQQISQPLTIFLIGATGDLSRKKVLKAIYQLYLDGLLPPKFHLIGNARSSLTKQEFHEFVRVQVQPQNEQQWKNFVSSIEYVSGDVSDEQTFHQLNEFHQQLKLCGNHLWYVATLPRLYPAVIAGLKASKLNHTECGWTKFLLEKPFGTDLDSAQELNHQLLDVFSEDQIYRVDHFLAKETVQNLLAFRFANGMFEHLWNHQFVDHIEITAAETIGVEGREAFYDATGTVRDVVQNHLLQMAAMTLMEEPHSLDVEDIRQQRQKLLKHLRPLSPRQIEREVIFAQYKGYNNHLPTTDKSLTETAVALRFFIDNDRWHNVPIYLRAGKKMKRTVTEISIVFKEPLNPMFAKQVVEKPNVLTFRIQPNEGIIIRLQVKRPGLDMNIEEVPMQFCYQNQFQMGLVEAYVKLIYDAVVGDATLFPHAEGIEAAWRFVQPILDYQQHHQQPVVTYEPESWGPIEFDRLMAQDKRRWLIPSIEVCQM